MDKNDEISYQIRESKRTRRTKISVFCDGRVVVTVPRKYNLGVVENFLNQKKNWVKAKLQKFLNSPLRHVYTSSKKDYQNHKEETRQLVEDRLRFFNQTYNCKYNKIRILNQKTRWGSCSRKGNLNFNYKIFFLSPELRDYVIVHELCHLKEFNHSKNFWNLVAITVPDYKELRKKLKLG